MAKTSRGENARAAPRPACGAGPGEKCISANGASWYFDVAPWGVHWQRVKVQS